MKKVFCFNNCACRVFRTNLVLVWFQCCPRYFSRKKGISGTFLSLGLRPRLQKIFPRFPFFYFGNLDNTSIRRGQICPQTWQHNYWNKILFCIGYFISVTQFWMLCTIPLEICNSKLCYWKKVTSSFTTIVTLMCPSEQKNHCTLVTFTTAATAAFVCLSPTKSQITDDFFR